MNTKMSKFSPITVRFTREFLVGADWNDKLTSETDNGAPSPPSRVTASFVIFSYQDKTVELIQEPKFDHQSSSPGVPWSPPDTGKFPPRSPGCPPPWALPDWSWAGSRPGPRTLSGRSSGPPGSRSRASRRNWQRHKILDFSVSGLFCWIKWPPLKFISTHWKVFLESLKRREHFVFAVNYSLLS